MLTPPFSSKCPSSRFRPDSNTPVPVPTIKSPTVSLLPLVTVHRVDLPSTRVTPEGGEELLALFVSLRFLVLHNRSGLIDRVDLD